ncbi:MAG: hypothetical protein E6F99_24900, partial [Actinobacteria bacterium]
MPGPDTDRRQDDPHREPPPEAEPAPRHRTSLPYPPAPSESCLIGVGVPTARPPVDNPCVGWTVLVPVKDLGLAKSRLRGALAGVPHQDLVLALVLDTLAAALACPAVTEVVVVTADEAVAAAARGLGAKVLADPPRGLNPALEHAAAAAGGGPLAALAADLPAL